MTAAKKPFTHFHEWDDARNDGYRDYTTKRAALAAHDKAQRAGAKRSWVRYYPDPDTGTTVAEWERATR